MKEFIQKILCFLGLHKWSPWEAPMFKDFPRWRQCQSCGEHDYKED